MEIGVWMLVFAGVFDVVGVGKRQWANRVAAVLALGGFVRLVAPSKFGGLVRGWAQQGADLAGEAMGSFDPQWGSLVASMGVAVVACVVIIIYFCLMAPEHEQLGPAAAKEISSAWIWGGAFVSALFVSTVPGSIGQGMTLVIGWGTQISSSATGGLVTLGHIGQAGGWI